MATITPYETKSGKRYRVRYRKPDHSQTDKRGFTTKREAELFAASIEVAKATGAFVDATAGRSTVGALGTAWLAHKAHMKPSARNSLQISWRVYVEPQWGSRSVSTIRHSEVQAWVTAMTSGTARTAHHNPGARGASTVIRAYGILAAVLDVAVKDRRLSSNPARGVDLPRKIRKPHPYLSHEQVELLAQASKSNGTLVRVLAYTGLRWGEATALRVRDVDALRRRLQVRENAVLIGGKIFVGSPKSHEARSVPFPKFLIQPLAQLCEGKRREQLVFGNGDQYTLTPSTRDGWYRSAIARAQRADESFPQLTLHDLRHTAASLAVSAGANVKALQRILGHASAAMTLDTYADLFDDDLDAVGDALDDARNASNVGKTWAEPELAGARISSLPRK
jgi:integrase